MGFAVRVRLQGVQLGKRRLTATPHEASQTCKLEKTVARDLIRVPALSRACKQPALWGIPKHSLIRERKPPQGVSIMSSSLYSL